jgi:hypothetical protein
MKVTDKVICDCCQRELKKHHDESFNDYGVFFPACFEDYFVLNQSWGYYSGKDTERHEAIICEPCYDEIFKDVKIHVTSYM